MPFLEPTLKKDYDEARRLLKEARRDAGRQIDKSRLILQYWDVFSTPVDNGFQVDKKDWQWTQEGIRFRRDHLLQMIDYIEERTEEWENE